MALDDGIYREVDQELAEEKQMQDLKKWFPYLIGLAVVVVAIVGGRQMWDAQKRQAAENNATAFSAAVAAEDNEQVLAELRALEGDAPAGYAALSNLRIASLEASDGNTEAAIAAFNKVSTDEDLPQRLRDMARVRAGYLALGQSGDDALRELSGLQNGSGSIAAYAKEIAGLAAMEAGSYEQALTYFEGILSEPVAPQPVRDRAEAFSALARLGVDGVSLDEEGMGQSLERLLDMEIPAPAGEEEAVSAEEVPAADGGTTSEEVLPTEDEAEAPAENSDENDNQQDGTSAD